MSRLNILISVIIGSFIGALAGVLFAPEKGEKTRKQLSKKSDEYAEIAKTELDEFVKKVQKKYDTALKETDDIIKKGKAKADEIKKAVK